MGSTMTDKTEAQPEALRLADRLMGNADIDECEGCNPLVVALERSAAAELRRQHAEIQQLKAQLSARQAAQDGWRLVPMEPTQAMTAAGCPVGEAVDYFDMGTAYRAMLSAAPPPPEREPLTDEQISVLGGGPCWAEDGVDIFLFARSIERAHGIGAPNAR